MKYYLAIDLGASSGRHIVGHVENKEIILDEVYRFPTGMSKSKYGLIWQTDRLFFHSADKCCLIIWCCRQSCPNNTK